MCPGCLQQMQHFVCSVHLQGPTKDQEHRGPKAKSLWMNMTMMMMMMITTHKAEDSQPDKADPEARESIQLLCEWKQANS